MSVADLVRAFRNRPSDVVTRPSSATWRHRVIAGGIAASVIGFGTIVVRAGDGAGVYEINRQYHRVREVVRSAPLPAIFQPQRTHQPMVTTALSYAPVFDSLMPRSSSGKRTLDDRSGTAGTTGDRSKTSERKKSKSHTQEDFAKAYISQRTSYCVRTCDGFFFPVGNPDSGDLNAHDASCQRACPGAETAVYVAAAGSAGIEDAVNRRGQRYDMMQSAFNHRQQFDNACTCSGERGGTARNYSVMTDFTLRKGDMVMSREGLKVFRGGDHFPHRSGDFRRPDATAMSAAERQAIQKLEAATMRGMSGATLSPSLKARIAAQVEATRSPGVTAAASARVARRITAQDGREMRYVGPDVDFDRAR